ncbi:MAG: hypothetical protein ABW178_02820 [Pseudoxanthomonas sp.]
MSDSTFLLQALTQLGYRIPEGIALLVGLVLILKTRPGAPARGSALGAVGVMFVCLGVSTLLSLVPAYLMLSYTGATEISRVASVIGLVHVLLSVINAFALGVLFFALRKAWTALPPPVQPPLG